MSDDNVYRFEPLGRRPVVQVAEDPHGGWEVVIRLASGSDLETVKAIAQDIRARGWVELSDYGWKT